MKWTKYLLTSVVTAALFSTAFPSIGWGMLIWVAFLPVLRLSDLPGWRRFFFGWLTGFLIQVFGYGWIFFTIRDFGGLNSGISLLGGLLFWLFQGLDVGLWLGLGPKLFQGRSFLVRAFGMAAFWLFIQAFLFPYIFPANYGAALAGIPIFGMGAALWSGKGMTFWIVAFQTLLGMPGDMERRQRGWLALAVMGMSVLGVLVPRGGETDIMRIGVVQPNLIPWAKRGNLSPREIVQAHEKPTRLWTGGQVDMVVWPETAVPFDLRLEGAYQRHLQDLAAALNAPLVTGVVGIYGPNRYGNEIWLIPPDGSDPQIYQKEKLVLFSETLPWIFSWAKYFDEALGGFEVGTRNKPFVWRDREWVPLVCFEALFPRYVRKRSGQVLLNVTNDAWFGETKASSLHLQHIRHRAVESGAPLIRATNSGISCFVDAKGEVQGATALYGPDAVIYEVPVPKNIPMNLSGWGEGSILLGSSLLLLSGVWNGIRRRRKKSNTSS